MYNFKTILLEKFEQVASKKNDLIDLFLSNDKTIKRYVIGKNEESRTVLNNSIIDGVIDDAALPGTNWLGIPCVKMASVEKDSIVVNCSTSISPVAVIESLKKEGLNQIINYANLIYYSTVFSKPWFVTEMEKSLLGNELDWNELYDKLADVESKAILATVALFRLTADPSIMDRFSVRLSDQYMEEFMCYKKEKFVDVGGFDGDTTLEFCTRFPDYKKVYLFEPSSKNMAAAKNRLSSFNNIDYFNFGLSNKEESLMFNENQGSASNIQNEGEVEIKVSMLDKLIQDDISFIKMDIEGWELNALKGASRHIVENHPKLAVAVYHHATDFIDIPKFVLSLNKNYNIYLRHYTQGWSETVMFFLPI